MLRSSLSPSSPQKGPWQSIATRFDILESDGNMGFPSPFDPTRGVRVPIRSGTRFGPTFRPLHAAGTSQRDVPTGSKRFEFVAPSPSGLRFRVTAVRLAWRIPRWLDHIAHDLRAHEPKVVCDPC